MASSKEVAKAKDNLPAGVYDYGEDAHGGFEETTINDLAIPFINLLQNNSPEVEDQTVEGAAAGMLLNSVTGELMKMPLIVQPVHKEEVWVEWIPRNKGGGVVERHDPNSDVVKKVIENNGGSRIPPKDSDGKRNPFKMPNGSGNDIVETYYVYCLILDEEGKSAEGYCVLAFSSTKITVQKKWMTSMYTIKGRPPMWANRAKVSTVKQKAEGGSFFNFNITAFGENWREGLIDPSTEAGRDLLDEAKTFRSMIMDGLAAPDMNSVSQADAGEAPAPSADGDDEMPF